MRACVCTYVCVYVLGAIDWSMNMNVAFLGHTHLCLKKRSALAVNCCAIIHCLEVSCKEDQITSVQRE